VRHHVEIDGLVGEVTRVEAADVLLDFIDFPKGVFGFGPHLRALLLLRGAFFTQESLSAVAFGGNVGLVHGEGGGDVDGPFVETAGRQHSLPPQFLQTGASAGGRPNLARLLIVGQRQDPSPVKFVQLFRLSLFFEFQTV